MKKLFFLSMLTLLSFQLYSQQIKCECYSKSGVTGKTGIGGWTSIIGDNSEGKQLQYHFYAAYFPPQELCIPRDNNWWQEIEAAILKAIRSHPIYKSSQIALKTDDPDATPKANNLSGAAFITEKEVNRIKKLPGTVVFVDAYIQDHFASKLTLCSEINKETKEVVKGDTNVRSDSQSSNSTSNNNQQPNYSKSYDGQKYISKYANKDQSASSFNTKKSEQIRLQKSYEQRRLQQQNFEQNIVIQNQQAFKMFEQKFGGDQLGLGLAQTLHSVGSAIGSGYLDKSSVTTGAVNVIGGLVANSQRRKEEKEKYETEVNRIKAEKKAYIDKLILGREVAVKKLVFPQNFVKAYESKTAYFYGSSFRLDSLKLPAPKIIITDIIAVNKYSDGTWPFEIDVQDKLQQYSTNILQMIGFFKNYEDANKSMNELASSFAENAVSIQFLHIADKFDEPQDVTMLDNSISGPKTDFWGNTISNENNTIESKTKKQDVKKERPVDDFWGTPLKIKKDN